MKHKALKTNAGYKVPAIIKKNHEPGAIFIYALDKDGNERLFFTCNAAMEHIEEKNSL